MNETAGGIIANAVIEDSRNHINFFGAGFMKIDSFPTSARIDLDHLRRRSIRSLPQRSYLDGSAEFLFYGRVFGERPFYFSHKSSISAAFQVAQSSSFSFVGTLVKRNLKG